MNDTTTPTTLDLTADLNTIAAQAEAIAQQVLRDGENAQFAMDPVGDEHGHVNEMAEALGGARLLIRAQRTDEVAVYVMPDGSWRVVADANGPVAIRLAR